MKKDKARLADIILPNKRINYFIISTFILGIISGSIFLVMLTHTDKVNVIKQINNFFNVIRENKLNSGLAVKNSLIINYIYIIVIWILGFSIIGVVINIFLIYIRGFILGFSLSGIVVTYKYKSIPACLLYVFPHQIFNSIVVCVLGIYSIMFTFNLVKVIMNKRHNIKSMLKKYLIILLFSIIITFISSMLEVYVFPKLLKMIIFLYK